MKKYISKVILFLVLMAVVDVFSGSLGDYLFFHSRTHNKEGVNDFISNKKNDIIVLGSSRAHHHYNTPLMSDVLGLNVYNAGCNGNGVVLAYGFLELILENYKPKLVVFDIEPSFDIDVYPPDNNHVRYVDGLKPYYRHSSIKNIIKEISEEEWHKVHSGLLRYNSNLVNIFVSYLFETDNGMRGYVPLNGQYDGELTKDDSERVEDTFKLKYLEKLILLCQEHEVTVVFVASPRFVENSSKNLKPALELCKRYNVVFLNYSEDSVFLRHGEWFKDVNHLNSEGAKTFSERIAKDIQKLSIL